jgi:hypothetical protein
MYHTLPTTFDEKISSIGNALAPFELQGWDTSVHPTPRPTHVIPHYRRGVDPVLRRVTFAVVTRTREAERPGRTSGKVSHKRE